MDSQVSVDQRVTSESQHDLSQDNLVFQEQRDNRVFQDFLDQTENLACAVYQAFVATRECLDSQAHQEHQDSLESRATAVCLDYQESPAPRETTDVTDNQA
jgi:hypothetical protein